VTYRDPDPHRLEAARLEAATEQAEFDAAIAAMKDTGSRRLVLFALTVPLGVPLLALLLALSRAPASLRMFALFAALACGWIGGIASVILGIRGLVRSRRTRAAHVVALFAGIFAMPWSLLCALAAALV
jgi:hypothetical protein